MTGHTCSTMIIGFTCAQTVAVMTVIVVIVVVVPVVSWFIHRSLKKRRAKAVAAPPLMYITAVSSSRTRDVDIPHLPSPSEASFLPPSYDEICNGAKEQAALSASSMSINIDDELPEYSSIASHRGSMVLSTFYSDGSSVKAPVSVSSQSDTDSDHERNEDSDATSTCHSNHGYEASGSGSDVIVA